MPLSENVVLLVHPFTVLGTQITHGHAYTRRLPDANRLPDAFDLGVLIDDPLAPDGEDHNGQGKRLVRFTVPTTNVRAILDIGYFDDSCCTGRSNTPKEEVCNATIT